MNVASSTANIVSLKCKKKERLLELIVEWKGERMKAVFATLKHQLIMRIRIRMMMVIHYECHMYMDINNFAQNNSSDVYDGHSYTHI